MKRKSIALLIASGILLTSCDFINSFINGGGGNTSTVEVNNVKSGLKVLNSKKNYTLNVFHYENNVSVTEAPYKFTENFIGRDDSDRANTDLIIKDKTGLYHLGYDTKFISGEYLKDETGKKYTNLFDNTVVNSMYGVETSFVNSIGDDVKSLIITSKAYKIAFVQTVGYLSTDYTYVDNLEAKFQNNKLFMYLRFIDGSHDMFTLTNIGSTKSSNYQAYLKSGGKAYTPTAELSEFRRLIRTNNFYQNLYYFDLENFTKPGDSYGYYYFRYGFAPHYWYQYSLFDGSVWSGYIEANMPAQNIRGVYGFSVKDGQVDSLNLVNPYFTRPDIITFQHYPTFLKLLDSLEYLKSGAIEGAQETFEGSNKYYFDNPSLVDDFVRNFSLDQSGFIDYPCVGVEVEINLNYSNESEGGAIEPVICFHYVFNAEGYVFDYPFPCYGFGHASIAGLDSLYNQLNPQQ